MSDSVAMKLNDEELKSLTDLHGRIQSLVVQLGQMDLRKEALRGQIRNMDHQAQSIMNQAATRLGIAQNTPWQMLPDGTVVLLDPETGAPKQSAPVSQIVLP